MDGKVKYESLKDAAEGLVAKSKALDEPIDKYLEQSQKIGEDGAAAWGGTAAEMAVPILKKIKDDIIAIQSACNEFSENAKKSLQSYQKADSTSESKVNDIIG